MNAGKRRLQTGVSVVVIFFCLAFLLHRTVFSDTDSLVLVEKSEVSECHFLLKHGYVVEPDSRKLILAAARPLEPYLEPGSLKRLEEEPDEESALRMLDALIQGLAQTESEQTVKEAALYLSLTGMVNSLGDPYTRVMDPETYRNFKASLESHPFGGLGLQLEKRGDQVLVFAILPHSPAAAADLRLDDELTEIDGQSVAGLGLTEIQERLSGEIASRVALKLRRRGSDHVVRIEREKLQTRSVWFRPLDSVGGQVISWLKITSMTDSTGEELAEQLQRLEPSQTLGLILDLRDNRGGYVSAALDIASLFLAANTPVVKIESRHEVEIKLTSQAEVSTLPIVVVVNENTSSSAEILAGCLQDYQRAVVVGEGTFGKGSVQQLHEFASGGGLRFTTARYTTPRDRVIDSHGLMPDTVLEEESIVTFCENLWKKSLQ